MIPPKGPEIQEFLNSVKGDTEAIKGVQSTISTLTGNEASIIEINKKSSTSHLDDSKETGDCVAEAATIMEKMFKFQAVEFEGVEEEEPEEGEEEEEKEEATGEEEEPEGEEAEEEDEETTFDPSLKEKKISFGETSHYCPVSLHNRFTLVPGNPEIQCKYRERFYRFSSEEARQAFMENPDQYLPNHKKKLKVLKYFYFA